MNLRWETLQLLLVISGCPRQINCSWTSNLIPKCISKRNIASLNIRFNSATKKVYIDNESNNLFDCVELDLDKTNILLYQLMTKLNAHFILIFRADWCAFLLSESRESDNKEHLEPQPEMIGFPTKLISLWIGARIMSHIFLFHIPVLAIVVLWICFNRIDSNASFRCNWFQSFTWCWLSFRKYFWRRFHFFGNRLYVILWFFACIRLDYLPENDGNETIDSNSIERSLC